MIESGRRRRRAAGLAAAATSAVTAGAVAWAAGNPVHVAFAPVAPHQTPDPAVAASVAAVKAAAIQLAAVRRQLPRLLAQLDTLPTVSVAGVPAPPSLPARTTVSMPPPVAAPAVPAPAPPVQATTGASGARP